jgi:hypothetical protein
MGAVKDQFDLACPNCGSDEMIRLQMLVWVDLRPTSLTTVHMDPHGEFRDWHYDGHSEVECQACGHDGTAKEFTVNKEC